MKTKKQKQLEALQRAESYIFENSKMLRRLGNNPTEAQLHACEINWQKQSDREVAALRAAI